MTFEMELNRCLFPRKYSEVLVLIGPVHSLHTLQVTQLVPIKQFICETTGYIIDAVLVPLSFEKHGHLRG